MFLNGEEGVLKFERDSGGYDHGFKMTLQSVELANGETKDIDITANTFLIQKRLPTTCLKLSEITFYIVGMETDMSNTNGMVRK